MNCKFLNNFRTKSKINVGINTHCIKNYKSNVIPIIIRTVASTIELVQSLKFVNVDFQQGYIDLYCGSLWLVLVTNTKYI